ncbi:hypothetical protein EV360DRAFT_75952 [Lentinula raphanica]|nr:hypothetical protein EV360DRAFT_75952 [Lentinula raphanica]
MSISNKKIPADAQSPNIARRFGTSTSAFELLVLNRRIMGPCWIQIKNPQIDDSGVTNISFSYRPLNIIDDHNRENKREVVCITARTWHNMIIDGITPPEQLPCTIQTFVRPLEHCPSSFEASVKANGRGFISPMKNEQALLNALLVSVHENDSDILVSHDFLGVSLDVLLHCMRDLKAAHWSRIGHFRRSDWPRIGKQGTNIKFLTGRMLCDLSSDAAKVQILPLTKQLANLAGNSWNKTLNGGRAERNGYILLHEFHHLKFICPDKPTIKRLTRCIQVFQEYNIDFTTIGKTHMEDIDEKKDNSNYREAMFHKVKSLMKDRMATDAQLAQWDIKQKALKPTADSMYGCLGFEYSRFYAQPLAALTTHMGREILQHTKELAESMQLDVLYGDTDSLFVNSNAFELSNALWASNGFKKVVNEQYKKLEVDLDTVFQRLLLLQKKKYGAVKVENGKETSIEVKGLDMKQREYSHVRFFKSFCSSVPRTLKIDIDVDFHRYVLGHILFGEPTEILVEQIHHYLASVGDNRTGKNPEDYPKAEGQPHVQVALKMKAKGGNARAEDVIPYVFCMPEGEEGTKLSQSDETRHRDKDGPTNMEFGHAGWKTNKLNTSQAQIDPDYVYLESESPCSRWTVQMFMGKQTEVAHFWKQGFRTGSLNVLDFILERYLWILEAKSHHMLRDHDMTIKLGAFSFHEKLVNGAPYFRLLVQHMRTHFNKATEENAPPTMQSSGSNCFYSNQVVRLRTAEYSHSLDASPVVAINSEIGDFCDHW